MARDEEKKAEKTEAQVAADTRAAADKSLMDNLAIAAGVAADAAVKALRASEPKVEAKRNPNKRNLGPVCTDCGQALVACKGKHRMAVIYPQRRSGQSFPGCWLNGVHYKSNGKGHLIVVPDDSNMENTVELWEGGEERLFSRREVMHDSGAISGSSIQGFRPT